MFKVRCSIVLQQLAGKVGSSMVLRLCKGTTSRLKCKKVSTKCLSMFIKHKEGVADTAIETIEEVAQIKKESD